MNMPHEMPAWPPSLTKAMGQFLPDSIGEVILQRALESEALGPDAWRRAHTRARLIRHICRRADIYLKLPDRARFRQALDEAAAAPDAPTPRSPFGSPRTRADGSDRAARADDTTRRGRGTTRSAAETRDAGLQRLVEHRRVEERLSQRQEAEQARTSALAPRSAGRAPAAKPSLALTVAIVREIDILTARTEALALAQRAGAGVLMRTRAATVVSELARNIFRYAGQGTIRLNVRAGQLRIEAEDEGPGIPDVDHILAGGYESKTGMGMGLCGSKKLADEFEVESTLGQGTRVRALLRLV